VKRRRRKKYLGKIKLLIKEKIEVEEQIIRVTK